MREVECLQCDGWGYILDYDNDFEHINIECHACSGAGSLPADY
jgi:DnaJ-class molecular chaperone